MINKKIILTILVLLVLPISVMAHYPEYHTAITLEAIRTTFSSGETAIQRECKENLRECIAGNLGADATVVYYFTSKTRKNYHGTHTASMYYNCIQLAGSDVKKRAICDGIAFHHMQDEASHGYKNVEGYTSLCVRAYSMTNLMMHPVCERLAVKDMLVTKTNRDEIIALTSSAYDVLEENPEYIELLSKSAGVDLTEPIRIVGSNLKESGKSVTGEAYQDIYNNQYQQYKFPDFYYYFVISVIFISLIGILLVIRFGQNWLKYIVVIILLIPLLIGLLASYFMFFNPGGAFITFNNFIDTLSFVHIGDLSSYINKAKADTISFMKTGDLTVKEATGLNHYEGTTFVEGTLDKAEASGAVVRWIIGIFFILSIVVMIWLSRRRKR